jgi:hypothetical protein
MSKEEYPHIAYDLTLAYMCADRDIRCFTQPLPYGHGSVAVRVGEW